VQKKLETRLRGDPGGFSALPSPVVQLSGRLDGKGGSIIEGEGLDVNVLTLCANFCAHYCNYIFQNFRPPRLLRHSHFFIDCFSDSLFDISPVKYTWSVRVYSKSLFYLKFLSQQVCCCNNASLTLDLIRLHLVIVLSGASFVLV